MLRHDNCETRGQQHCWSFSKSSGTFQGYGEGTMRMRTCNSCGIIEYVRFNNLTGGREIDIDKVYRNRSDRPWEEPSE